MNLPAYKMTSVGKSAWTNLLYTQFSNLNPSNELYKTLKKYCDIAWSYLRLKVWIKQMYNDSDKNQVLFAKKIT